MDDIMCICKKENIDFKLSEINNLHPSLSFTVEIEKDDSLPFLDMIIYNNNGNLSSGWYRKATDTGLTLNFLSLAPFKYKKSVVIGLVHRIYRTCSSWQLFDRAIEEAKIILHNNQYPLSFIEDIIYSTLNKILSVDEIQINDANETNEDVDENNSDTVSIDSNAYTGVMLDKDKFKFFANYRGKPTEKFIQSLYKLNAPCKFILTLKKTKNLISTLKVPVPDMLQSNVVYQITCSRCQSSYVGQTSRHLQQRFREHIGSKGLLKKHFEECDIFSSEDMVKILGKSSGEKLMTLEALYIAEINPVLNTKDEYRSRTLKLKF